MSNTPEPGSLRAPYCSADAFSNLFERLRKRGATRVDQNLLETWGVQQASKLIPALKFLGVIKDNGDPDRERWVSLAQTDPERFQNAAMDMVHSAYAAAFEVYPDLEDFADSMIGDVFAEIYKTAPGSRAAAVRFFRHMLSYYRDAGPPVERPSDRKGDPPSLKDGARTNSARRVGASSIERLGGRRRSAENGDPVLNVVVNVIDTDNEDELVAKFQMIRRAWQRATE